MFSLRDQEILSIWEDIYAEQHGFWRLMLNSFMLIINLKRKLHELHFKMIYLSTVFCCCALAFMGTIINARYYTQWLLFFVYKYLFSWTIIVQKLTCRPFCCINCTHQELALFCWWLPFIINNILSVIGSQFSSFYTCVQKEKLKV